MFYSEQLLTREGPLAHVWLAANVERKLTKQQLLHASITQSTKAIAVSSAPQNQSRSNDGPTQVEPLALRVTGQLLFGVVRIYSRKAKYLLDDVSDALMKLKSAFKTTQTVVLPPERTVISSIKALTMPDTVTETDLLYQPPLNFEDAQHSQQPGNVTGMTDSSFDFNASVEIARGHDIDDLANMGDNGNDLELDLNFDLGEENDQSAADRSIEVGRGNDSAMADTTAEFGLGMPDLSRDDSPHDQFNFGFEPLELAPGSPGQEEPTTPQSADHINAQVLEPQSRKSRLAEFADSEVVRTNRKRIMIDEVTEIPSEVIRSSQTQALHEAEAIGVELGEKEKLEMIYSAAFSQGDRDLMAKLRVLESENKRRRLNETPIPEEAEMQPFQDDMANANDFNDFAMPPEENSQSLLGDNLDYLEEIAETIPENTPSTTKQIASQLRLKFGESEEGLDPKTSVSLSEVLKDEMSESRGDFAPSEKREASRCFFEMLVLASGDAITLKQERLFGEIHISGKSGLYKNFL